MAEEVSFLGYYTAVQQKSYLDVMEGNLFKVHQDGWTYDLRHADSKMFLSPSCMRQTFR